MQGQPIRNDLKAPVIDVVNHQVGIGQVGTRCTVVAKGVQTAMAPASVFGDGEWEPEAPKKALRQSASQHILPSTRDGAWASGRLGRAA